MNNDRKKGHFDFINMLKAQGYSRGLVFVSSLIGQPFERVKVYQQTKIKKPSISVYTEIYKKSSIEFYYRGFYATLFRQMAVKPTIRVPLTTSMPSFLQANIFSPNQISPIFSVALKALASVSIDVVIINPLEVVKTVQMSSDKRLSLVEAINLIKNNRGYRGFYAGSWSSVTKGFPAWFNLFASYELTNWFKKDKKQAVSLLETVGSAVILSAPVTFLTTPPDVIKSHIQAESLRGKSHQNMWQTSQVLFKERGASVFWRGFLERLVQKSANLTVGLLVMRYFHSLIEENIESESQNSNHKDSSKERGNSL